MPTFTTTLSALINSDVTTIPLVSVAGLPAAGVVSIGNELIAYSSISGLNLEGCARGYFGTTNAGAAQGATVNLVGLVYPASLQSTLDLFVAINNFATTLPNYIGSSDTAIAITASTGLPASGILSIDQECIFYGYINTSGQYPVLENVIRGFDNTTPSIHAANAVVEMRWTAIMHNTLAQAILLLQGVLGANPAQQFPDLTTCLGVSLPLIVPWTADGPSSTVSVVHTKSRLVGVQLWWYNTITGNYEELEAPTSQSVVINGTSTVNFTLPLDSGESMNGYAVLL